MLAADQRVDAALEVPLRIVAVGAVEAADAGSDLVGLPGQRLLGQIGIGDQSAGHAHAVGLAGGDDLLRLLRIEDGADGVHGDVHPTGFLDILAELGVDAQGTVRAGHAVGEVLRADLHQVHVLLRLLQELGGILDGEAVGIPLGAGDADADELLGADAVTHGLEDHHGEAAAVLPASAELIGAGVDDGGHELGGEPAVAEVQQHRIEPGVEAVFRGIGILLADVLHILHGHGLDLGAVEEALARHGAHGLALVVRGLDPHAAVGQLSAAKGAVLVDGLGHLSEQGEVVLVLDHLGGVAAAVANGDLAQVHDRRAAPGLVLHIADVVIGGPAVHRVEQHVRG